ncbi:MAG TPA: cache domain-containing protein [Candidatus Limnocylindria bacterium]|nr:cache domain-containing protein [Candidatus Limnocylindria bacterium]
MRSLSVELKLAMAVLAACLAAAVTGAWIAGTIFERNVESAGLSTLRVAADAFAGQERSEIEKLAATTDALLANEDLRAAFEARDRERLLRLAAPLFATIRERDRITHWYFIDVDRTVFLRVHKPELRGDLVERATLQKAIDTRELGAGKELGQTAFALRAVRPWLRDGRLVGYVELAEEIDHFLTALKSRTGDEYGLLVKKKFLNEQAWARVLGPRSNTWNDRPDVVVVDTTTFTEGIIDYDGDIEAIPDGGDALGELRRGDRAYVRGIFPVLDAAGRKVGGLFVLHDFTRAHDALRSGLLQAFLVLVAIGIVTAAAIAALVRWVVFGRLERLRRDLEARAARDALPPSRYVELESEDEIGRLEGLLRRVLYPSRARQDPDGGAPKSASSGDR